MADMSLTQEQGLGINCWTNLVSEWVGPELKNWFSYIMADKSLTHEAATVRSCPNPWNKRAT